MSGFLNRPVTIGSDLGGQNQKPDPASDGAPTRLDQLGRGASDRREPAPARGKRSPLLRVLAKLDPRARPGDWEPRPGVPKGGRAECRNGVERPCPYVRCAWHLWRTDANDRAGRRARIGEQRRAPEATLLPAWLEYPTPACCGLDLLEGLASGLIPGDQHAAIADAVHLSDRRLFQVFARIRDKLRANPELRELHRMMSEFSTAGA